MEKPLDIVTLDEPEESTTLLNSSNNVSPTVTARPKLQDTRITLAGHSIPGLLKESSLNEIISINYDTIEENSPLWIDVEAITDEEMQKIGKKFKLHPLTKEDILNHSLDEREKVEMFDNYVFIVCREMGFQEGTNLLMISNICVVMMKNVILTFHAYAMRSMILVFERIKRISILKIENEFETTDWIIYAILDSLIELINYHVISVTSESESLDELVLVFGVDEIIDVLQRIGASRRFTMNLFSHLMSKKELLNSLVNKKIPMIHDSTRLYLRDVLDDIVTKEEKLNIAKDTINYVSSTYLARASIVAAEASNRVNQLMKIFGAMATIFLPLTLVAGIFGMNVKVPGQDEDSLLPFFIILICMMIEIFIVSVVFVKKGWL